MYHVGLPIAREMPQKKIMIQLSKNLVENAAFLDMNALLLSLDSDPDLCAIPNPYRSQCLQTLYKHWV